MQIACIKMQVQSNFDKTLLDTFEEYVGVVVALHNGQDVVLSDCLNLVLEDDTEPETTNVQLPKNQQSCSINL